VLEIKKLYCDARSTKYQDLKSVEMGQDWIDFKKFRWSLVCSCIIIVEMHKIAD